ncbi:MAG TPA: PrgI family protein [Candidatus Binatia bacterium]|nr:PrgI family protein [Candidatus Binatia bacterium]
MQFAVPQFTDIEDKLIGPLTLKQFLILLGAGGIVLFFWSLFGPSLIFFIIALPIGFLGVISALGRYNGRPMFAYLMPFISFVASNKVMIFRREVSTITLSRSDLDEKSKTLTAEDLEPAESRLKKLAYMLDKKTEQEKELLSKNEERIIQAATMPKLSLKDMVNKTRKDIIESTSKKLDLMVDFSKKKSPPKKSALSKSVRTPNPAPKRQVQTKTEMETPQKFDPSSFFQK